jgi:hypothetical protein
MKPSRPTQKPKKLPLRVETVRVLRSEQLEAVVGGYWVPHPCWNSYGTGTGN